MKQFLIISNDPSACCAPVIGYAVAREVYDVGHAR